MSKVKSQLVKTTSKLTSMECSDPESEEEIRELKEREQRSEEKQIIKQLELANGELFRELKILNESMSA